MKSTFSHAPKSLKITYIGGGSRGWAWQLMSDLALEADLGGEVVLYDIDENAARINQHIGNALSELPCSKGHWRYTCCSHLEEALQDCDFVIISILPGTFDEMESDVHAPEACGVYQPVGDTTGPGGLVRSLRAGPMFQQFARAIAKVAPKAWVINYTNPMAQCLRVLYATFPQIRAIGCCHEVFATQRLLAFAMDEMEGIKGIGRQDLQTTVMGVNHFTWITQATYQGRDILPVYRAFAEKHFEQGFYERNGQNWMNDHFACANRVKFDLFLRFGYVAAAGDRHLAEFNPGTRYLSSPDVAHSWGFGLTPVSWRKQDLSQRLARAQRLYNGEETFPLTPSGEEGVQMIKALSGLGDMITNVNLPNVGQVSNIPMGTVVESNAILSVEGVRPLMAGAMPLSLLAMSMPAITAQDMILNSIITQDASLATAVLYNDPLMCRVSRRDAQDLYQTMLDNTSHYLSGWNLEVKK